MTVDRKDIGFRSMDRITILPDGRGSRPACRGLRIPARRGLRITVADVLEMRASARSHADILEAFAYLGADDITAPLTYAAKDVDHRIVTVLRRVRVLVATPLPPVLAVIATAACGKLCGRSSPPVDALWGCTPGVVTSALGDAYRSLQV